MSTELDVKTAIGQGFYVSDFLRTQGAINTDCLTQRIGEFIQFVGAGRFVRSGIATTAMSQIRASYSNAVDGAPGWLGALMREYMDLIGVPPNGLKEDMKSLYRYMVATGRRVKSRQFTYGSVTANPSPSPAGNGTIYIWSKDENDFDIENTFAETVTFECVNDQGNGGTKFKESFRVQGTAPQIDDIKIVGGGGDSTFPGVSSDDSSAFFQNCSWSQMNSTGTTKFDFWTLDVDDLTKWTQDTSVYYQQTPADPVQASLKITGNGNIYQLFSAGNTQFPSDRPMLFRCPIKPIGVNAGCLIKLVVGEQVVTYTVTGAEADWVLSLVIERSNRSWYKQFAKNGGRFQLEVHGMSAGTIWADNAIAAVATPFNGLWYAMCAGSTPFKVGDKYTFTHTCLDNGIIQRFCVQHSGVYLPMDTNASAITWSDPIFHT